MNAERWSKYAVWLVPLLAAVIAGWLGVKALRDRGTTITISFATAQGIQAHKTLVKYKDVQVGTVDAVSFSPDLQRVVVRARIAPSFQRYLADDTRFWVERPRISLRSVSGLDTLLSGPYIAVDAGDSTAERREFTGLDMPPVMGDAGAGTPLVLRAANAGSFDVGSPILYRRLPAGQITATEPAPDGSGVVVTIFVNAPFDRFVTPNSRFWNESGIDAKLDTGGIKLDIASLASVLVGGIAFETPGGVAPAAAVAAGAQFELFENREAALKNPEPDKARFVMLFNESVHGLRPGAPVDFRGVAIGEVTAIKMKVGRPGEILSAVEVDLYPGRIAWHGKNPVAGASSKARNRLLDSLVASGLRGQLRPRSLIAQDLYIAMDFFPASAGRVNWAAHPPELPTQQAALVELQAAVASIAGKLERLPLEEMSGELRETLQSATRLLNNVDANAAPQLAKTLATLERALAADSPLQSDTRRALREVSRAAQSMRVLADYLERHPEALLTGKKGEQ